MTCRDVRTLRPMLAMLAEPPLADPQLVYETKYDGIRALAEIQPRGRMSAVRLFSRLGNEKSAQFPEIVEALAGFGARLSSNHAVVDRAFIIDGEIVALDERGRPAGFQQLQGRIHLTAVRDAEMAARPVAFIAFDILCEAGRDVCDLPLTERRVRLEQLMAKNRSPLFRISDLTARDGRALFKEAVARGWEGLIVKRADSLYRPGKRSPDWRKLKLVRRQEFVVAGWTEPRASRSHFGALLLGYYDGGQLKYAGHTGSGFDEEDLARVWKHLQPLETRRCPFAVVPHTNERPHWVDPVLVADVKFSEWTQEGLLRHPIYLGLREDVDPAHVRREPAATLPVMTAHNVRRETRPASIGGRTSSSAGKTMRAELVRLRDELQRLEAGRGEGAVSLGDGTRLSLTNLRKPFWPKAKITKGELLRYYLTVAPYLLPVLEDRPLVMKRLPNGVTGKTFYQQRAPDTVPEGVRVEQVEGDTDVPSRLIGGSLLTLLYMTQLAAISQDPWFSRVQSPHAADQAAIDLDPGDGVPFARVLDVARWVRDELETLGVRGFPKTSGADGLHIYIPLRPGTPYEAGQIFCQIIATIVAQKHPKVATVERSVRARGRTVYVDYLQNIEGKTLACAYSARASDYAGASSPLTWTEVDEGVDRRDFTIRTLPGRLDDVGDLWAALRQAKGANLRAAEKYIAR
jgi:bifunctional non-homologous end joining protein LigD